MTARTLKTDVAVLARLSRHYGCAIELDEPDRQLMARCLAIGDNSAIVSVGDGRFVVIYGDGSEERHDLKAPVRGR